jgi:anaerobic magnesium-protoporphyrin IX monomethyl ester cyclase
LKIALCVPPYDERLNATCAPFGLGYIAGYLRQQFPSVELKIFDGMSKQNIHDNLKAFLPQIIGVTATTSQAISAYALLDWIKAEFPVLTVIGGVHASAVPEEAANHADVVVVGEGEIVFAQIVQDFADGKKPCGILQGEPVDNLNDLPPPAYDLLDIKYYLEHGPVVPGVEYPIYNTTTSRGCPYRCPFCHNSGRQTKVRYLSAERIIQEIEYIHERFGVSNFYFSDDEFVINLNRLKQFASLIKQKGMDKWIRWACQARTKNLTEETVKIAKSCGCITLAFGIESGNATSLKYWKCGTTTPEDHERAIKLCLKHGLVAGGSFIYGLYGETLQDMQRSFKWFTMQDGLKFVGTGTIIPFPGTEVWRYCMNHKLLPVKVDYNLLAPTYYVKDTYIIDRAINPKAYANFMMNTARLARIYAYARLCGSLRKWVGVLGRRPAWWWAWAFHPLQMVNIVFWIVTKKKLRA